MKRPSKPPFWRVAVLLAGGAIIVTGFYYASRAPTGTEVSFNFRRFRFRQTIQESEAGDNLLRRRTIRHVGPFKLTTWETVTLSPVGTNQLRLGMVLYHPESKREFGRVQQVEKWYEFPDGEDREGVLVLSSTTGLPLWTPRTTMNKLLFGSPAE